MTAADERLAALDADQAECYRLIRELLAQRVVGGVEPEELTGQLADLWEISAALTRRTIETFAGRQALAYGW